MAPKNTPRQGASTKARKAAGGRSTRAGQTTRSTTTKKSASSAASKRTTRGASASKTAPKRSRSTSARGRGVKAPTKSRIRAVPALSAPVIAVLVIAAIAWSFYPVMRVQYQEERNRAALQEELEGLQARNDRLRAQVDRLKTPEGVEELARENLGMVKEGENLYVVTDGEEATAALEVDSEASVQPQTSAWQKVLDVLFGFDG